MARCLSVHTGGKNSGYIETQIECVPYKRITGLDHGFTTAFLAVYTPKYTTSLLRLVLRGTLMSKPYINELARWVQSRTSQKTRQDQATVAFMGVKALVEDAICNGYALTTIWEHMQETGKLTCSYETFRRHVNRFIKSNSVLPLRQQEVESGHTAPCQSAVVQKKSGRISTAVAPAVMSSQVQQPHRSGAVSGFQFVATPRKEDLI